MPRKPVEWGGSSRKDIQAMPVEVRRGFGGASVLEIVEDYQTDTYRAVYTVRFEEAVYVLHVFQKKARQGAKTPARDLALVRTRLAQAEELHRQHIEAFRKE